MSDIAIKVENISKRYRIGLKEELHDTFFGALASWVKYPLSNLQRVQKLSKFSESDNHEDIIWALRNVSFEVKEGEVLGIIGRNGAGKTTLLKILCRITEPTSGRAEARGRIASLLEVGTGFHQELTGRENVFLNGAILGMSKSEIENKFDEIVDFSGIGKFIDTPVKRYSSGMAVRLAFAVAAHLEPEILLIDEVLAVGDYEFQNKCLGKMENIAGEGRTVLFVSHNMGAIEKLCSRAILLDEGKITQNGPTNQVISQYIGSGKNQLGEKIWTGPSRTNWPKGVVPGEEVVRLKAVRVLNDSGEVCTNFTVRDNIYLQMDYEVFKERNYLDVGFQLTNERGELVMAIGDNSRDNVGRKGFVGSFQSTCKIPRDLLNNCQYFILAGITEERIVHVRERDVVSFYVMDSMDPEGARGLYHQGEWPPTIVRPKIEWETIRT